MFDSSDGNAIRLHLQSHFIQENSGNAQRLAESETNSLISVLPHKGTCGKKKNMTLPNRVINTRLSKGDLAHAQAAERNTVASSRLGRLHPSLGRKRAVPNGLSRRCEQSFTFP